MTSRERFEQSGITSLLSRSTEPGFTDEYADSHAQFAWRAWQAAERDALERALEAGTKAALDDMPNQSAFATWCRVRNAIRALIEQDAQSGEKQK